MSNKSGFLHEPVGRLLAKNCGPAMVSMLVMALYQIVDGMMVGRRLGPDALAAVNILYPVIAVLVGLAVMIGVGGNARIAFLLGSGKEREARGVLSLVVVLGFGLGLLGTIGSLLFAGPLTAALGAGDGVQGLTRLYLLTIAPFFTAYIVSFILDQAVRNDGQAGFATLIMVGGALLNIGLDYVFLFVFDMGIAGAALASALGQSFSATVFMAYFIAKAVKRSSGLRISRPTGGFRVIPAIAVNGSSELLGAIALGIVTLMFNRALMDLIGPVGVAGFALVQYVLMLAAVFFNALGAGSQPVLSQNYGAGLAHRVTEAAGIVLVAGVMIGTVLAVGAHLGAARMALMFVPDHPEAIAVTSDAIRIITWSMPLAAIGMIGSAFFTSIEKAGMSLAIAAGRGLVCPVIALAVLPAILGATGIWLALVVTEAAGAAVTAVLLRRWKSARPVAAPVTPAVLSVEHPELVRAGDRAGASLDAEFAVDVGCVPLHGIE